MRNRLRRRRPSDRLPSRTALAENAGVAARRALGPTGALTHSRALRRPASLVALALRDPLSLLERSLRDGGTRVLEKHGIGVVRRVSWIAKALSKRCGVQSCW